MHDSRLPDLTFPNLTYGKYEIPWDLRPFLYRYGAGTNVKTFASTIEAGTLGPPLLERIELVRQIHSVLLSNLDRGGRRTTVESQIAKLRQLFLWADETDHDLNHTKIEHSYRSWTDSLLQRVRLSKTLSEKTAYEYGKIVGSLLDRVLGRSNSLVKTTRLRRPRSGSRAVSPTADRQNLEETFAFGHFLLDVADGLSIETIWGPLPVRIQLRSGKVLEEWSGLKRTESLKPTKPRSPAQKRYLEKRAAQSRGNWQADTTTRTRYSLINLRVQAEMFMLMGQPAVNLAQVHQLRMDQWRYKPSTNGFEIRTYKHRRWGQVVFEIYSSYRAVFERYLKWRSAIFPDDPDGLLFPLLGKNGAQSARHPETAPQFDRLKNCCKRAGIRFLSPNELRSTNVNWMLRRTQDPDLTAEEKQHATKTLLAIYEKPSQQRAMVQIKGFWAKNDPAQVAAGPGLCLNKTPEPIPNTPAMATKPDCVTPAGCLFCSHQRDIDSLDHVWSLASYRLLKSYELSAQGGVKHINSKPSHPAELVIQRLTDKLNFIKNTSPKRRKWVDEALVRIEEGRYHPSWSGLIDSA